MSLITICESKRFCQTFVANGNKISFIFRRMLSPPPERITFDFFIGNQYWRLKSSDSTPDFELQFEDKSLESKDTNLKTDLRMGTSILGGHRNFNESFGVFFSVIFKIKFSLIRKLVIFFCNRVPKPFSLIFLKTSTKRTGISLTTKKCQIILRNCQQFQPILRFPGFSRPCLP